MRKTCIECKKEFETTTNRRKYCSDVCAGKARRRKINEASKRYQKRVMNAFRKTI